MTRGLLYLAKGATFVAEAERSAQQAASVMPEYPITIVADREPEVDCFDTVIVDETSFEKRNKPQALQRTPYDRTIYLDTDIYLNEPVPELFDILDNFELGLRRGRDQAHVPDDSPLPEAFPEFNSGVIPYRSTEAVMGMLEDWERRCLANHEFDQRSLRPALYHSDVRFTCLPTRYNCMYRHGNVVDGPVKVFHGPLVEREGNCVDVERAVSELNDSTDVRVYYRWNETLFVAPEPSILTKARSIAKRRGIRGVLAATAQKLFG